MGKRILWALSAIATLMIGSGLVVRVLMDRSTALMEGAHEPSSIVMPLALALLAGLYSLYGFYRFERPEPEHAGRGPR